MEATNEEDALKQLRVGLGRWVSNGKYVKDVVTRTEFNVVLLNEHGTVTEVVHVRGHEMVNAVGGVGL